MIGFCKNIDTDVPIAVARRDVLSMLHTVFSTLTVAMRYEPANAKFFTTEVSQTFVFSVNDCMKLMA